MITFQTDGVEMPRINEQQIRNWVKAVAATYQKKVGEIGYLFCSDERILEVNRQFLRTTIIRTSLHSITARATGIAGDLVISLDTVRTNAEQFGAEYETELSRVIIHGILHLCGINDKGPGEREIMEAEENKALALLADMNMK